MVGGGGANFGHASGVRGADFGCTCLGLAEQIWIPLNGASYIYVVASFSSLGPPPLAYSSFYGIRLLLWFIETRADVNHGNL